MDICACKFASVIVLIHMKKDLVKEFCKSLSTYDLERVLPSLISFRLILGGDNKGDFLVSDFWFGRYLFVTINTNVEVLQVHEEWAGACKGHRRMQSL